MAVPSQDVMRLVNFLFRIPCCDLFAYLSFYLSMPASVLYHQDTDLLQQARCHVDRMEGMIYCTAENKCRPAKSLKIAKAFGRRRLSCGGDPAVFRYGRGYVEPFSQAEGGGVEGPRCDPAKSCTRLADNPERMRSWQNICLLWSCRRRSRHPVRGRAPPRLVGAAGPGDRAGRRHRGISGGICGTQQSQNFRNREGPDRYAIRLHNFQLFFVARPGCAPAGTLWNLSRQKPEISTGRQSFRAIPGTIPPVVMADLNLSFNFIN